MLLSPSLNLITGPNGAGKSSLIEAMTMLATGQSFRTRQVNEVITLGYSLCRVTGRISSANHEHRLGLERDRQGKVTARLDGQNVRQLSHLSDQLPLRVLHPESNKLLLAGSSERRRFIDWLLFHVEHSFRRDWQDYQRALLQRNTLLKQVNVQYQQCAIWDEQLDTLHQRLTESRQNAIHLILGQLPVVLKALNLSFPLDVVYHSGADPSQSLQPQLEQSFSRCLKYRNTLLGAHKADILFKVEGVEAKKILSRGQIKALTYALLLAQITVLNETKQKQTLVLMDDLTAELDSERVTAMISYLQRAGQQLLVTATDRETQSELMQATQAMFHVEHGSVSQVI